MADPAAPSPPPQPQQADLGLVVSPAVATPREASKQGRRGARLREANREQMEWGRIDLSALVEQDHPVRVIVGVDVTNRGSDAGQSTPMLAQVERRTGVRPSDLLVDGAFAQHAAIEQATAAGVTVYAPVPASRTDERGPHEPREGDSPAVASWRVRMGSDEAKAIYKQRAATAETVNADAKTHRGLDRLRVRGLGKALASATLFALTYDILRLISLGG